MVLMGIDPSLKRTGISIYDLGNDKLTIMRVQRELNKDKTFVNVWKDAENTSRHIFNIAEEYKVTDLITEIAPPQGIYSPALYGLDCIFISKLYPMLDSISVINPNWIGSIHGARKYPKSQSSELGKRIVDMLTFRNVEIDLPNRVAHDEYESLIILSRLMVSRGLFVSEFNEINPKFLIEKEKKLK